jgi:hypothetical protein
LLQDHPPEHLLSIIQSGLPEFREKILIEAPRNPPHQKELNFQKYFQPIQKLARSQKKPTAELKFNKSDFMKIRRILS